MKILDYIKDLVTLNEPSDKEVEKDQRVYINQFGYNPETGEIDTDEVAYSMMDIEPYTFDKGVEAVLKILPYEELIYRYNDIAEGEWGPLNHDQKVRSRINYEDSSVEDIPEFLAKQSPSAWDYIQDLISSNKLTLYNVKDWATGTKHKGDLAGLMAPFSSTLNPDLTEGPDTLFLDDTGYFDRWEKLLSFDHGEGALLNNKVEVANLLHELGHTHLIDNIEIPYGNTDTPRPGWKENLLLHNTKLPPKETREIWMSMDEFIEKYIE